MDEYFLLGILNNFATYWFNVKCLEMSVNDNIVKLANFNISNFYLTANVTSTGKEFVPGVIFIAR